jgi:hypothetical protein
LAVVRLGPLETFPHRQVSRGFPAGGDFAGGAGRVCGRRQIAIEQSGGLGFRAGHEVSVAVVVSVIDAWPMSVCRALGLNLPASLIAAIISDAKVCRHSCSPIGSTP